VGKVLATGLVDYDRLQNQFLISCASMGNQLLRIYDLGMGPDGVAVELTPERISQFFFDVLHGNIPVSTMSGEFDLASIVNNLTPGLATPVSWDSPVDACETVEQESPGTPSATAEEMAEQAPLAEEAPPITPAAQEPEPTRPKAESTEVELAAQVTTEGTQGTAEVQPNEQAKCVCKHCGTEAEEGSAFCENCGQSLI
jgi:hypothetical protein